MSFGVTHFAWQIGPRVGLNPSLEMDLGLGVDIGRPYSVYI